MKKYFSYSSRRGFELHDTTNDAEYVSNLALDVARDLESIEFIAWGAILKSADNFSALSSPWDCNDDADGDNQEIQKTGNNFFSYSDANGMTKHSSMLEAVVAADAELAEELADSMNQQGLSSNIATISCGEITHRVNMFVAVPGETYLGIELEAMKK